MKDYQKQVDKQISQHISGYWKPLEILARLVEEVGELAREINYRFGPKKKKPTEKENDLGDEIADVIYTLICLANSLNINLDTHLDRVLKKYSTRDKDRWRKK